MLDAFAADADVAVVGPHIVNPDGTHVPVGADRARHRGRGRARAARARSRRDNRFTRAYRQIDADPDAPRDVDWVSGAALWFRRAALDRVGGWDERYFMFLEDVDVCRAITAARRPRRGTSPAATVMHVVGASRSACAGALGGATTTGRRTGTSTSGGPGPAGWRCPAAAAFLGAAPLASRRGRGDRPGHGGRPDAS